METQIHLPNLGFATNYLIRGMILTEALTNDNWITHNIHITICGWLRGSIYRRHRKAALSSVSTMVSTSSNLVMSTMSTMHKK